MQLATFHPPGGAFQSLAQIETPASEPPLFRGVHVGQFLEGSKLRQQPDSGRIAARFEANAARDDPRRFAPTLRKGPNFGILGR